jgi:hypothetical protein
MARDLSSPVIGTVLRELRLQRGRTTLAMDLLMADAVLQFGTDLREA